MTFVVTRCASRANAGTTITASTPRSALRVMASPWISGARLRARRRRRAGVAQRPSRGGDAAAGAELRARSAAFAIGRAVRRRVPLSLLVASTTALVRHNPTGAAPGRGHRGVHDRVLRPSIAGPGGGRPIADGPAAWRAASCSLGSHARHGHAARVAAEAAGGRSAPDPANQSPRKTRIRSRLRVELARRKAASALDRTRSRVRAPGVALHRELPQPITASRQRQRVQSVRGARV